MVQLPAPKTVREWDRRSHSANFALFWVKDKRESRGPRGRDLYRPVLLLSRLHPELRLCPHPRRHG